MSIRYQGDRFLPQHYELAFDAEVSYAGMWYSINDHFNYRMTPEGFGSVEQTRRRKTVTSDFFDGDYEVGSVRASVKRTWEVHVFGQSQYELQENINRLTNPENGWFTQDQYNVRVRLNEFVETFLCDPADFSVDQTHVLLHNLRAKVRLSFSCQPTSSQEILL